MTGSNEAGAQFLQSAFSSAGQGHLFTFWDDLDEDQRQELLGDLSQIRLDELRGVWKALQSAERPTVDPERVEPAPVIFHSSVSSAIREKGCRLLSQGRVAALTVAGGQGTRFGFEGPKGGYPISPVRHKSLFQLFAEHIRAAQRRYGGTIRWYIMTSLTNDRATRSFFAENGYFALSSGQVRFFRQGVMPAFDDDGRILLDQKYRVALSPDGHGGTLSALTSSGMLDEMAGGGVDYLSYFQVDNPLVSCIDPVFIGLHVAHGSEMSCKAAPKSDDLERVGNFVRMDDGLNVIEYSDFPDDLARLHNSDGSRRFDAANLAIHILSRSFVERLTVEDSDVALEWHAARKKVPYVDLKSGQRIEPSQPNAIKPELFIFDALPRAQNPILMSVRRDEEFSPVKNKTGVDSVDSARWNMSRRAARWLAAAGMRIPRDSEGEIIGSYEISPLVAMDAEELVERNRVAGCVPAEPPGGGDGFYLGE